MVGLHFHREKAGVIFRKVVNRQNETLANIENDVAIVSCSMLNFPQGVCRVYT